MPSCCRSSSPGEFHPEALTEPCVNLSIHTALHSSSLFLREQTVSGSKGSSWLPSWPSPPSSYVILFAPSITDASTLLQDDPLSSSASIFPFSWVALIAFLLSSLEDFPCSA